MHKMISATFATFPLILAITMEVFTSTVNHKDMGVYVTPDLHVHPASLTRSSRCVENLKEKSAWCKRLNLTQVPNYLSRDIEIIYLYYNSIRSLYNSSFLEYSEVKELQLSYNDIRRIELGTFLPLKLLEYLDISDNHRLQHVEPDIFKWSQSLNILLMRRCGLRSFPQNSIFEHGSTQAPVIRLDGNQITHINIACSRNIEQLYIPNNKIEELRREKFKMDCDVNELNLFGNPLDRVDPTTIASLRVQTLLFGGYRINTTVWKDMLIGISRSKIRNLYMQGNRDIFSPEFFRPLYNYPLSTLTLETKLNNHKTLFSSLNFLLELKIKNDDIPRLDPKYFGGMDRVQILSLESNCIKAINPANSSWPTVNVREISLKGNELYYIARFAFQGLTNLSFLDLSYNEDLTRIYIEFSSGLSNLEYLDISETALTNLFLDSFALKSIILTFLDGNCLVPGETFSHTRLLEWLDLTKSSVVSVYLWEKGGNASLFDGLGHLKTLLLPFNPIFQLVSGMFRRLHSLEFLDLSNCQISSIQSNVFRGLRSLNNLSLQENNIYTLPHNLLVDLNELMTLNLTFNNLYNLNNTSFEYTTSLRTLLLAANEFTEFNFSTFKPIIDTVSSVDISRNHLTCTCGLSWLANWLNGNVTVLGSSSTFCSTASATLEPLRGKPLLTFNPKEFCGPRIALFCSIPLAVVGLIAVVLLGYHYRWLVKFKLYLVKLALIGYEEVLDAREHGDFEFDLNIMFMEEDEHWVREHLKPFLEERLPNFNRNAVGDGDLILGMHYLDSVYYIIEKSFKTVFLLSRASFKDTWFMVKFRIAFEHLKDTQMENVVVVFLEDIPDAELPFLVRLYLSERRTYIWWVEDERDQEYFWDELFLTLRRDTRRWNNLVPPE